MKYRLIPITLTFLLVVIGHILLRKERHNYLRRKNFVIAFQNNFISCIDEFVATQNLNTESYGRFIHDVDKIQIELGEDGIVATYIDPLRGVKCRNYQVFVNLPNELRTISVMPENSIIVSRLYQLVGLCDDILRRHVGNLDRKIEQVSKKLWNPFVCFGTGINWILKLPGNVLEWTGIVKHKNVRMVYENWLFSIVSKLITFVGLVSSIITIALGWKDSYDMLVDLFGR